jgi:DNA-binding CsgD family transcriptional regulator
MSEALTPKQRDVLTLVALGLGNREVAACLGLGENTVRAHMRDICKRLGVSNRTAAAVWWLRAGRERGE